MNVIWLPRASIRFREILSYGKEAFGPNTVLRFQMKVEKEVGRLSVSPIVGKREPLLADRQREYRSLVIRPHFKLIYYINKEKDTVFISHLWDTRMNPAKLVRRFR